MEDARVAMGCTEVGEAYTIPAGRQRSGAPCMLPWASYLSMMRLVWLVLGGLGLLGGVAQAKPTKAAKPKREIVALFVTTKEGSNASLVGAIDKAFAEVARTSPSVEVLTGKSLDKLLKAKAEPSIASCGASLTCIAKLGKRVGATRVVYARTLPSSDGKGIRTQVLVVGTQSRAIENKAMFELASLADVDKQVSGEAFVLSGLGKTGSIVVPNAMGEVKLDGVVVGSGPGPHAVPVGRHEVLAGGERTRILIPPGSVTKVELALRASAPIASAPKTSAAPDDEPALVEGPSTPSEPALELEPTVPRVEVVRAAPASAPSLVLVDPAPAASHSLTYVGIGALGAGVAAAAVGGYFGYSAGSLRDSVDHGPRGTTQLEAVQIERDADARADRANIAFAAGGVLALAGAVLVALDQLGGDDVAITPTGSGAAVHF